MADVRTLGGTLNIGFLNSILTDPREQEHGPMRNLYVALRLMVITKKPIEQTGGNLYGSNHEHSTRITV
jgi:hypothetical protein